MQTPTDQDHQLPRPPRFAVDTEIDPAHEVDVDLGDEEDQLDLPIPEGAYEQVLSPATMPEGGEHLGSYASLERYLRAQLEDQVSDSCQWLLDCLDFKKVQTRFEADGSRLLCESGEVYRIEAPEPDLSGPWMPGRH